MADWLASHRPLRRQIAELQHLPGALPRSPAPGGTAVAEVSGRPRSGRKDCDL